MLVFAGDVSVYELSLEVVSYRFFCLAAGGKTLDNDGILSSTLAKAGAE